MAQKNRNAETTDVKNLLLETPDLIREIVTQTVQQILESEMDEALGARRSERTEERAGHRSGYYDRIRDQWTIRSHAVMIAIGINQEGRRCILSVELAERESRNSWTEFLRGLRERGLQGVEFVVSDDHAGLKAAIREVLTDASWQRCYVHFLRNALDYLPRHGDHDCLQELRWIYRRRDVGEARRDLAAWVGKWLAR